MKRLANIESGDRRRRLERPRVSFLDGLCVDKPNTGLAGSWGTFAFVPVGRVCNVHISLGTGECRSVVQSELVVRA